MKPNNILGGIELTEETAAACCQHLPSIFGQLLYPIGSQRQWLIILASNKNKNYASHIKEAIICWK
jgi:hypothetical protein